MLNEMEDYRPPADEGGSDGEQAEQAGSDGEAQAAAAAEDGSGGDAAGEGKKAKRRRKRGQKLSALEFEASRRMAKQIAECSGEEQADWLWDSFQQHAAASNLERGGLTAAGMAPLPAQGPLENRLKALAPAGGWKAAFCSREGPVGSPVLLLVSPSAMGSVNLIKMCPSFNKVSAPCLACGARRLLRRLYGGAGGLEA